MPVPRYGFPYAKMVDPKGVCPGLRWRHFAEALTVPYLVNR